MRSECFAVLVLALVGCAGSDQASDTAATSPGVDGPPTLNVAALEAALAKPGIAIAYRWVDTVAGEVADFTDPQSGEPLFLDSAAVLTLADIDSVRAASSASPAGSTSGFVTIKANFPAAQRFLSSTSARRGQRLAVLVNDVVVQTATIESPLAGTIPMVTGTRWDLADRLASRIQLALNERSAAEGAQ